MVVKKRRSRREHIAQKAAELAPPEEQPAHARGDIHHETNHPNNVNNNGNDGAILVDEGKLNLPKGLMESGDESGATLFGLHPVVVFILALALSFIAFIAYLISQTE